MGETAGDLISQTFKLGYGGGTVALIVLFLIAFSRCWYKCKTKERGLKLLSFKVAE